MLHENHPLPPTLRRRINARKKEYVHFVENLIAEVQRARQAKGPSRTRSGLCAAGNDQLDLSVVQARRRPANSQPHSPIY